MDALLFLDEKTLAGDIALDGAGLAVDPGLETAYSISFFTDRRADDDDVLLDPDGDKRGWWGDAYPPTVNDRPAEGDRIGSKLWQLSREKIIRKTINRCRDYLYQSTQWLIDDGVVLRHEIYVEAQPGGVLAFLVDAFRPDGSRQRFRYLWDAQLDKGVD